MKKKRILLVCNYFAPENAIAAVRTSKLAKHFKANGYEIDVLTEQKENMAIDETLAEDAEGIRVFRVKNSKICIAMCKWYESIIRPHKDKRFKRLDNRERVNPKTGHKEFYTFETAYPVIGSLDYIVGQLRQLNLARAANKLVSQLAEDYDILITSYGDSFCYFVGKSFKNKRKEIPWIFDIRDPVYLYKATPDYVKWIPLGYEKYIWKHADAIVGISKGICRRVSAKYRSKVTCITNGYEKDIISDQDKERISDKLSFTYTGSMYGGLRDLSEFFETIRFLVEEKRMDTDIIEFHYAGNAPAYEIFKNQAGKYGLDNHCVYHGKLSRKESMKLQRKSDILLMASYDYQSNNGGIITGKIFEYMGGEKPVIAVVTGDIEDSEVSQIISKTNIGICCEYAKGRADQNRLKDYIFEQYLHFKDKEPLVYEPVIHEVKKYDYKNIAKRYIMLMRHLEQRRL